MKVLLTIVFTLFAVIGIAQVKFVPTTRKTFASCKNSDVIVFYDTTKIPKTAQDVGLIIVEKGNEAKAYKKAEKIAAKHGANAMYVKSQKNATSGEKFWYGTGDKLVFVALYVPEWANTNNP